MDMDPARRFLFRPGSVDYYHAEARHSNTRVAPERHPRRKTGQTGGSNG